MSNFRRVLSSEVWHLCDANVFCSICIRQLKIINFNWNILYSFIDKVKMNIFVQSNFPSIASCVDVVNCCLLDTSSLVFLLLERQYCQQSWQWYEVSSRYRIGFNILPFLVFLKCKPVNSCFILKCLAVYKTSIFMNTV